MQSRDINTVANNKSSTLKIVDRCFIDYFARRHKVTHPDGKPKAKMGFKSTNFLGIRQRIVKNQGLKSRQVSWMPDLTLALVLLLSEFESWLSLRFLTAIEYFRALRFLIHFEICKFASRIGSDLLERPEDNILRSRQALPTKFCTVKTSQIVRISNFRSLPDSGDAKMAYKATAESDANLLTQLAETITKRRKNGGIMQIQLQICVKRFDANICVVFVYTEF